MTDLWSGTDIKIQHAHFFLDKMGRALAPPERTQWSAASESSGAILASDWSSIYAYLDAFLGVTRSIPDVINCCFGHDTSQKMATWFRKLPQEEQTRRQTFSNRLSADRQKFSDHALSNERNVSLHRTSIPSVVVAHTGFFGVTYVGGPGKPIPLTETRPLPEGDPYSWLAKPIPLTPKDFTIDGRPLFDECRGYIEFAQQTVEHARQIAQAVHGSQALTTPLCDQAPQEQVRARDYVPFK